jgi:hypothetical protein
MKGRKHMPRFVFILLILGGLAALGATAVQTIVISNAGRELVAAEDAAAQREVLELGHTSAVYSSGSGSTFSSTPSPLDFAASDPLLSLDEPGRWRISGCVIVSAIDTDARVELKLHRTNNTPFDFGNTKAQFDLVEVGIFHAIPKPDLIYDTTNSDDEIKIYGQNISAGSDSQPILAWITAERIR